MRWLLLLVLTSSAAHAEGSRFSMVGLGTSMAANEPGWAFRTEFRQDVNDRKDDPLFVSRIGLETWDAGGHWGFSMPLGFYSGAQVGAMRTTLGGGVGLLTFEKNTNGLHFGVSPFVGATLEGSVGTLHISLDGKLARQVVGETADFNVYSVMLMVGKRFER